MGDRPGMKGPPRSQLCLEVDRSSGSDREEVGFTVILEDAHPFPGSFQRRRDPLTKVCAHTQVPFASWPLVSWEVGTEETEVLRQALSDTVRCYLVPIFCHLQDKSDCEIRDEGQHLE